MITPEQLRGATPEDLCSYIASLHVINERLVSQNEELVELLERCRTTIEMLLQVGTEDAGHALH